MGRVAQTPLAAVGFLTPAPRSCHDRSPAGRSVGTGPDGIAPFRYCLTLARFSHGDHVDRCASTAASCPVVLVRWAEPGPRDQRDPPKTGHVFALMLGCHGNIARNARHTIPELDRAG
jgi:hypothetical protein